jgi:Cu/Ag efflux protein CusF
MNSPTCVALLLCLLPSTAWAQDTKTTRAVAVVTGRVDRVDPTTRSLTVRTSEGLMHTVFVGKELKSFDAVRSGDTVTIRISESVVVALRPNAKTTVIEDHTAAAKKGGRDAPAEVLQQLKATVVVLTIDMERQLITYKTADNRSVVRTVSDRRLIEGLKPGDIVELTYTRERAIELTKNQ